jgi:hypothetical protein
VLTNRFRKGDHLLLRLHFPIINIRSHCEATDRERIFLPLKCKQLLTKALLEPSCEMTVPRAHSGVSSQRAQNLHVL